MVENYSGIRMMDTKPVVGKNAFSHESGIHIAAMLDDPETYENLHPETVGSIGGISSANIPAKRPSSM